MHCAAERGYVETLKLLDERVPGPLVRSRDNDGYTAVMICASMNHVDALRFCLANGCSSAVRSYYGETPLMLVHIRNTHAEVVKVLAMEAEGMKKF